MAFYRGPKIVTNGLVLALDAANLKSYAYGSTVWNDLSGNNNNGSLINAPALNNDSYGSLVFNGTNQYVSSNVGTTLDIGTSTSVTLSCWIKYTTSAANYTGLVCKATSANPMTGFQMLLYANKLSCELASGAGVFVGPLTGLLGTTTLNTGRWFNTVLTINRSTNTVSAYVNGVLESSQTNASVSTSNLTSTSNLLIGTERSSTLFLSGSISNVQIYNRALSAAEVAQNYNAIQSRFQYPLANISTYLTLTQAAGLSIYYDTIENTTYLARYTSYPSASAFALVNDPTI